MIRVLLTVFILLGALPALAEPGRLEGQGLTQCNNKIKQSINAQINALQSTDPKKAALLRTQAEDEAKNVYYRSNLCGTGGMQKTPPYGPVIEDYDPDPDVKKVVAEKLGASADAKSLPAASTPANAAECASKLTFAIRNARVDPTCKAVFDKTSSAQQALESYVNLAVPGCATNPTDFLQARDPIGAAAVHFCKDMITCDNLINNTLSSEDIKKLPKSDAATLAGLKKQGVAACALDLTKQRGEASTTTGSGMNDPQSASQKALGKSIDKLKKSLAVEDLIQACMGCEVIAKLLEISDTYGQKVFKALQNAMLGLLGIFAVVWSLFHVARIYTPFTPMAQMNNLNNMVVSRMGIVFLVGLFLGSFANFWHYVYAPIVVSGMQTAGIITNTASEGTGMSGVVSEFCGNLNSASADGKAMAKSAACLLGAMQRSIGGVLMQALQTLWDGSWTSPVGLIMMILSAAPILWFFGKMYLLFPLQAADVIIRWLLLAMLSPLIIAAFVLPGLRSITTTALKGMIQSSTELVIQAAIIGLTSGAVDAINTTPSKNALGTDVWLQLIFIGITSNMLIKATGQIADAFVNPQTTSDAGRMDTNVAGQAAQMLEQAANATRATGSTAAAKAGSDAVGGAVKGIASALGFK
ncbi:MAG: hypothetical protein ACK5YL_02155 [Holosporales bacterium]